jgi:NhaP-type Na+/H+ and K+/H+ antiporter
MYFEGLSKKLDYNLDLMGFASTALISTAGFYAVYLAGSLLNCGT